MEPYSAQRMLFSAVVSRLPDDARIALCCGGAFLERAWPVIREELGGRKVVAILDDSVEKQRSGRLYGIEVKPIDSADAADLDAIIVTTDSLEDRMVRRLATLADAGVQLIRAADVHRSDVVTPETLDGLLDHPWVSEAPRPEPWNESPRDKPISVGLEINNECNINCVMCETHEATRPRGQMSLELFEQSLDQLEAMGIKSVSYHTIGEPTLHRKLPDILRISHERGFEVMLSTNGIRLHRFFDALVKWPVAHLRFSADGATRETYERIRVGAKFDQLMDNIRSMHGLIAEHKLPTVLSLAAALSTDNIREVPIFYETYGPYIAEREFNFSFVNSLTAGDGSYHAGSKLIDEQHRTVPCVNLWRHLYLGHDGRVSACCRDYHGELVVGDVADKPLTAVWADEPLAALRATHLSGDEAALPDQCKNCYSPETIQSQLLSMMIAVIHRTAPHLPRERFVDRILRFVDQMNKRWLRSGESASHEYAAVDPRALTQLTVSGGASRNAAVAAASP